jgi:hypothetical protein
MRDLLIFIFILKTTGTFTPVHSAGIFSSKMTSKKKGKEINIFKSLARCGQRF